MGCFWRLGGCYRDYILGLGFMEIIGTVVGLGF